MKSETRTNARGSITITYYFNAYDLDPNLNEEQIAELIAENYEDYIDYSNTDKVTSEDVYINDMSDYTEYPDTYGEDF